MRNYVAAAALLTGIVVAVSFLAFREQGAESPGPAAADASAREAAANALRPAVSDASPEETFRLALGDALPEETILRAWEEKLLERGDPFPLVFTLNRIARAQAKLGQMERARATFRLADHTAMRVASPDARKSGLLWVASARAKAGETEVARETFDRFIRATAVEETSERVKALTDIAVFQSRGELRPAALETLKTAHSVAEEAARDERSNHPYQLLMAHLELRDYPGAIAIAEESTGSQGHVQANFLRDIAGWTQDTDRATAQRTLMRLLEVSRSVSQEYPRAYAQAAIAEALARAGDVALAQQVARAIGEGDPDPSETTDESLRPMAAIAAAQARAGDSAGAKATLHAAFKQARAMSSGAIKSGRLREIAETRAALGDLAGAREAIDAISGDNVARVAALVALARAEIQAGHEPDARATFRQALAAASGSFARKNLLRDRPAVNRAKAFRTIATAQAETGDIAGALATIAAEGSSDGKSTNLAELVPIQAHSGDVTGALETTRTIPNAGKQAEARAAIAQLQARTGNEAAALDWIGQLDSPDARWTALLAVVDGLLARRSATKP
jgi:tetratricopeptide (TPR) repeat protein